MLQSFLAVVGKPKHPLCQFLIAFNGWIARPYFRLTMFPIRLPPLCEQRDDSPQPAIFFMERFATEFDKRLD